MNILHLHTRRSGRRYAVAVAMLLATMGAAFPALALCCCTEHAGQTATAQQPAADSGHADCHGEPAADNGLQLTSEQSACICSTGHAVPEHEAAAALHVQPVAFAPALVATTSVTPADPSHSAFRYAERATAGTNLPIVHCALLI